MIDVVFPAGYKEIIAPQLTQWDYGQTLRIYGLNLPQIVQIHFCDKSCEEAIVRIGNLVDDHTEVAIPDKLLENAYDNHAFIFVESYEEAIGVNAQTQGTYYTKSGDVYTAVTLPDGYIEGTTYYRPCGKTVYKITIPVIGRTKPENFIDPLTPDEITMLQEMINMVNGTLDDINALYEETLTIPELQEMLKDTKVNDATHADSADSADSAANADKINALEIKRDANGVLKIGDTIIPQRKLLFTGETKVEFTEIDLYTDTETVIGRTFEVVTKFNGIFKFKLTKTTSVNDNKFVTSVWTDGTNGIFGKVLFSAKYTSADQYSYKTLTAQMKEYTISGKGAGSDPTLTITNIYEVIE